MKKSQYVISADPSLMEDVSRIGVKNRSELISSLLRQWVDKKSTKACPNKSCSVVASTISWKSWNEKCPECGTIQAVEG